MVAQGISHKGAIAINTPLCKIYNFPCFGDVNIRKKNNVTILSYFSVNSYNTSNGGTGVVFGKVTLQF